MVSNSGMQKLIEKTNDQKKWIATIRDKYDNGKVAYKDLKKEYDGLQE